MTRNKIIKDYENRRNLLVNDNLEIKSKKVTLGQIEEYFTGLLNAIENCKNDISKVEYENAKLDALSTENSMLRLCGYDREEILDSEE